MASGIRRTHRNLALCTKAYRGWPAEVFDKHSTSVHALLTPEATIESIAYLIANPVDALAVRYAKDWPGAHTLPELARERIAERALAAWTQGDRSVRFPVGTWWMRVCHGSFSWPTETY